MTFMPSAIEERPILVSDIGFIMLKLILHTGEEYHGPNNARLSRQKLSRHDKTVLVMVVDLVSPGGLPIDLRKHAPGRSISQVCYQMIHTPSEKFSPIFDHKFDAEQVMVGGNPQIIGKVDYYPAEDVWPELCKLGYYGELPQFYL